MDKDTLYAAIVTKLDVAATNVSHHPLTGGSSAEVEAVEFNDSDGKPLKVVVRRHVAGDWKPQTEHVTATEFRLLKALSNAGLPVPKPLFLDDSGTMLPSPYFVMEFIDGTNDIAPASLPDAIKQMSDFLLYLHRLDVDSIDCASSLPTNEDPIAGALAYIPDTPENKKLLEVIANWEIKSSDKVLLHGDYWPGNLMWRDDKLVAVIDWEDVSIGTAAADLACCRSELMVAFGESAMNLFTSHYLAGTTSDLSDLPVWEVYASHAALQTMSEWGLAPEVEAHRRARTIEFADQATARLTTGF